MSCLTCKKQIFDKKQDEREKIRKLAALEAEIDGKTKIIIEYEGKLSIICEDSWIGSGRIGRPIEYFIA